MKAPKSILIVGGSGFVGTHLTLRLREKYKVYSTYHRHPQIIKGVTPLPMDALERDILKRMVYMARPHVVIYLAGKNDVKWAEEHDRAADAIHAGGSVNVLGEAHIFKPKFIFLSNSYVFDGKKGNYHENDTCISGNALGKAKVNAEGFIRTRSFNHVIIRTAPLFGKGNVHNPTFIDRLRIHLEAGKNFEVSTKEYHNFTPVEGIIQMLESVIEAGISNQTIHYGSLTKLNHYEFARFFAERYGYNPDLVVRPQWEINAKIDIPQTDFSLNFTEAVNQLKVRPMTLSEGFDLFDQSIGKESAEKVA